MDSGIFSKDEIKNYYPTVSFSLRPRGEAAHIGLRMLRGPRSPDWLRFRTRIAHGFCTTATCAYPLGDDDHHHDDPGHNARRGRRKPANVTIATTTSGGRTIIVTEAPPALQSEVVLAQPSPNYVWIAGYWTWRDNGYQWVSGHWELPPNPGSVWVAPRWEQQGNAYKFTEGYWTQGAVELNRSR